MATGTPLTRTTPEAEGIPSSAILDFIRSVEQHTHPLDSLHGFMLLRHGNVVAEGWWDPYGPTIPHSLYSLSKSFASTTIGIAVSEGLLTVEDPVLTFFPDDVPANPSDNLKAMNVRHLLSMNTGHQEDTTAHVFRRNDDHLPPGLHGEDDNWPRAFLSLPVEHKPGTWFVYNTGASYMLSAIITKLTGETLLDYLRPRLFAPLGIENPTWETDPRGISIGGTGLHITTEDIARFGQLYLQKGAWQGQQLVSEAWIAEATRATSDNSNTMTDPDWIVGYGYQFWRSRHDCYRGDGAFGQYCIVFPDHDAVLAINSGTRDLQAVLDNVWTHLLPAMHSASLSANPAAHTELRDTLATLSLPLPAGQPTSSRATYLSGKPYDLDPNDLYLERLTLDFSGDQSTLTLRDPRGDHKVEIGSTTWLKGTTDILRRDGQPVATAGAWTTDDTFTIHTCFYEGELCPLLRVSYSADDLRLEIDPNVSWGNPTAVTITGHAAG